MQSLPCKGCGIVGFSVNAHVGRKGAGARRKADYDHIVPLLPEIHAALHKLGRKDFERLFAINLTTCAADVESAWAAAQPEEPTDAP